jgi:hypothetical protein
LAAVRATGSAPCLLAADWITEETGCDPAASVRAACATGAGVARLLKRRGGLAALMGGLLDGLPEVADADVGDVATIVLRTGECDGIAAAAIRTAHGWALATAEGVHVVRDAHVLRAWRV